MKNKLILSFFLFLLAFSVQAQSAEPEMADSMRSNGKIFIVLGCVLLVLAGVIGFLLFLERRISRLEKQSGL